MANEYNLDVNKRETQGKSDLKQMRKEKKIPGVYYSHDSKQSIPLYINTSDLTNAQKSNARIFTINVGGKKRNVLFKSVQYHPVTDQILHIDLYGIKMDQLVSVNVAMELIGSAKGVIEEGGILTQGANEVEIECLPSNIPDNITIDISHLALGDVFRVEDVEKNDNFTIKTSSDQILVSVTQAMKEEVVDEEVAEETDTSDTSEEAASEETADSSNQNNEEKENE
ncbi:MAG: 50S ribosomal protein L25 [Candidatus Marinimicrobia bacterium]|nr:50S ribosomal protein L25 [Candidatus Neomarinimicrobiota bacterium]|tara:strand:- start:69272 stop:69949 length:678 start_codon:yes stop_codon:yes gene_type:complete